ncbi:MAG: hypothetical protein GF364_20520 [Candidatus Lokiarchaeota archaeon]|nr:hypothetical protein [Candidatus Lokiarchaeota archaeon]
MGKISVMSQISSNKIEDFKDTLDFYKDSEVKYMVLTSMRPITVTYLHLYILKILSDLSKYFRIFIIVDDIYIKKHEIFQNEINSLDIDPNDWIDDIINKIMGTLRVLGVENVNERIIVKLYSEIQFKIYNNFSFSNWYEILKDFSRNEIKEYIENSHSNPMIKFVNSGFEVLLINNFSSIFPEYKDNPIKFYLSGKPDPIPLGKEIIHLYTPNFPNFSIDGRYIDIDFEYSQIYSYIHHFFKKYKEQVEGIKSNDAEVLKKYQLDITPHIKLEQLSTFYNYFIPYFLDDYEQIEFKLDTEEPDFFTNERVNRVTKVLSKNLHYICSLNWIKVKKEAEFNK